MKIIRAKDLKKGSYYKMIDWPIKKVRHIVKYDTIVDINDGEVICSDTFQLKGLIK